MSLEAKTAESSVKHMIAALKEQKKLLESQELELLTLDERLSELKGQVKIWRKERGVVNGLDLTSMQDKELKQAHDKAADLTFSIELYERRINYFQAKRDLQALRLAESRGQAERMQQSFLNKYARSLVDSEVGKLEPLIQALALLSLEYRDSSTRAGEHIASWEHAVDRVFYRELGTIRKKVKETVLDLTRWPELEGVLLEPARVDVPKAESPIKMRRLIESAELHLEEAKAEVGI